MRDYESIFILAPTLDEAESEKVSTRMQDVVTSHGGEFVKVEKWGKRKLAYEVGKHKKGEYILFQFKGGPETVAELERNYKLTESVIKYMTIRLEKEALVQQALAESRAAEAAAAEAAGEAAAEAGEAPAEETSETGE
ncbi:MAG: 30S ribosomal protein S6 [Nitrospirae bacterium]|nr:30S ribosomal protein S6 [Nitrospirota bacterium]MBI5695395.1 30S ribosomal protein S6 [Nitrospirota bacterium]